MVILNESTIFRKKNSDRCVAMGKRALRQVRKGFIFAVIYAILLFIFISKTKGLGSKVADLNKLLEERKKLDTLIAQAKAKESEKNRKLLNKQKILIGGYMVNQLEKMNNEERKEFIDKVIFTISDSRKSDKSALEKLLEKLSS